MQSVGVVGIILYGVSSVYVGLAHQQVGAAPDGIDCAYRVRLLRDRVVALTLRSPQQQLRDPQEDVVSTLIRETHAACAAKDADSAHQLDALRRTIDGHLSGRGREAEDRRELLAH